MMGRPGTARQALLAVLAMALAALPATTLAAQVETVVEVRVHGNYETPDDEVLAIAGIAVGTAMTPADIDAGVVRLLASGRFSSAQILRRYRSLTATDEVVLIVEVTERRSVASKLLFLPEITYNEDEKFSLGARVSGKSLLGGGEMISLPVSWFGVDRVALEVRKDWDSGWAAGGSFGVRRYENPHYLVDDSRVQGEIFAERALLPLLRLRAHGAWEQVDFAASDHDQVRYGLQLTWDTRPGGAYPFDSVLLRAGWEGIAVADADTVNRIGFEAAAYRTLVGPVLLAVRGLVSETDRPLPIWERSYVGGMVSLRGTKAGTFSGDGQAQGTVELRIPITSMRGAGRAGFTVFWDTAAVWEHGERASAQFHHGVGAGVFAQIPLLQLNLDVGNDLHGNTRVHFGLGFRF